MQDPTDRTQVLVDAASRGDSGSIATLIEQQLPGLRAFVRLRMGKELRARETSGDLVQSTCREVLARLDRYRYRGEANFRHWLYATALRKLKNRIEFHRAARRDPAREVALPGAFSSDEQAVARCYARVATPSQQLVQREQMTRFESAFDRLPEHYREVLTLSRLAGLSHREVAQAMGRTEVATRSLLHRATAVLLEMLAEPEGV